jgi:adenine-specific DNA-methyltransferase
VRGRPRAAKPKDARTESYIHREATLPARPEAGQQARFRKKKPKAAYRYDSSLAPELNWDGQNPAREHGEWLIACIEEAARLRDANPPFTFQEPRQFTGADGRILATVHGLADATEQLKRLSRPFLDWSGKAERLSFEVPTLPLFVHERLSTQAIIETLRSHRTVEEQTNLFSLFGDPQRPMADAITKAYEHQDEWVNRLILGDSLVVMNSLLQYEGLGGQVQMIYMDPPYGVKFGSNFQPFVRSPSVDGSNKDEDMTREPEMVKAYRDTWELNLHSYLTYLRDRFTLSRDLLAPSGSIFVQISDTNLHHVRTLLDAVFGPENFVSQISFQTTSGFNTSTIATLGDFILWYARDITSLRVNKLYQEQPPVLGEGNAKWVLLPDGSYRGVTATEKRGDAPIPNNARLYSPGDLKSQGASSTPQPFEFRGKTYEPGPNHHWKANYPDGLARLARADRIHLAENSIRYRRFATDFPFQEIGNLWTDTLTGSFTDDKLYVVQTNPKVVERCMLLATNPGDLVLDPTCGSGTTAFVAENWGRRWISIDTSRVPLALTRQRLLSATYPYFSLKDDTRGPSGGFTYTRKRDKKGNETGGIVPHIKLETIANDEPPEERILVDRPDRFESITRVTGPFCVEATIPTPLDLDGDGEPDDGSDVEERGSFVERMLDTLRRAPILQLAQGRSVTLRNIRLPARTLALSAEAVVDATAEGQKPSLGDAIAEADEKNANALPFSQRPVAIVFGPENGAVSERLVYEAAQEARAKGYTHLYVIGFSIQPNAEKMVSQCEAIFDIAATWVAVTPDVVMGDLLKTTRASQIFSVAGRPEIDTPPVKPEKPKAAPRWQVKLLGLDTFDPVTMEVDRLKGNDVPCWMLDPNYNGRVFMAAQVFFPRTKAWESLKKALKATHAETVWDHLAGDLSAPFEAGGNNTIAVKVIDERGNELMVVKSLPGAGS